jgi:H+-transporting ATPase
MASPSMRTSRRGLGHNPMKVDFAIRNTAQYKTLSTHEALAVLETTAAGLTSAEASQRLARFGFNEVAQRMRSPVVEFLLRYWGPMPWLLELAIALSLVLRHYLEVGIIALLLTVNSIIGQIQSRGSQRALHSLKKRLAVQARVLRDGEWATIQAREIVPGDVIAVGLGDIVPADAKLLSGEISLDQSALTGESLPSDVRQSAVVYSGSIVRRGEARGVVVNTGAHTYFGRTAELVRIAKPQSHQEQIMLAIVRYMMYLGIGALALVAADAALLGTDILSIATFAVIFLMGAVPVALPAVMTIVQAVGATELAHKGVLVTRLDSIEDAASIDVLCLDKTGTITQNRLTVSDVVPFAGYSREEVAMIAALASQAQGKDPIDEAILDYARGAALDPGVFEQVSFTPFEPATRRSVAVVTGQGRRFTVMKGASQTILALCQGLGGQARTEAEQAVEGLSCKGFRCLGVARSDGNGPLQFVGLISLADPARPDSRAMIESARGLGVRPMMLTGDNIAIAREMAREVAIGERIVKMEEFREMDEAQQAEAIEQADGFAEIYPEDKYRIVKLLQSRGHLVGMTGDGVNDAPALKQAEMGIAVSSSTDVAKASASAVLVEPGVGVIIDALKTSRHIYQRMLTWVINKVTKVIQVVGLLTIGYFWFRDTVVSLLGMALLVFANDFVTMSLATDNVEYTASPNTWNVRNITFASLVIGALLVAEGVLALVAGQRWFDLGFERLRTFVMLTLVFTSQFRVVIVRERRYFWSSWPGTMLLVAATATVCAFALLGCLGPIVPPLTPFEVGFALGFSALFTFAIDVPKYLAFKRFGL